MMHLSVPEHHMASMAATLQPDMHHQKQDQVCLPAISAFMPTPAIAVPCWICSDDLALGLSLECALCVGMGSSADGAPACHVVHENQLLSHARWLDRCESYGQPSRLRL